ncbi:MAG: hypothetical protein JJ971_03925 [Balneolaceae bacterium]|nr:hypothetical protein [Balneolaceae bacterium]MBO6545521.1 hypothetical protein [Balneolaceae bacterium]MBO6646917.1 hypothetical protein [Balneolaceae bacterium]
MKSFSLLFLSTILFLGACTESSGPDDDNPGQNFSHTLSTGASANDFLSSDNFTTLNIEIDYVEGFRPSQSAIDNLEAFLEQRLNKPGGVSVSLDDAISSPQNDSFTAQEIYALEQTHRDTYSDGNTISAYFIILDGAYETENVLGVAYYNTSMALFEEVIQENTGGFGQPSASTVEASVLMHEFGHILGLVNIGTEPVKDHEDPENEAHCDVESCLMYWAIQTTDLMGNLTGGEIPELDAQCVQDLKANGGK